MYYNFNTEFNEQLIKPKFISAEIEKQIAEKIT